MVLANYFGQLVPGPMNMACMLTDTDTDAVVQLHYECLSILTACLQDFTFSIWTLLNNSAWSSADRFTILDTRDEPNDLTMNIGIHLFYENGEGVLDVRSTVQNINKFLMPVGRWVHLAFVFNMAYPDKLYMNGIPVIWKLQENRTNVNITFSTKPKTFLRVGLDSDKNETVTPMLFDDFRYEETKLNGSWFKPLYSKL